MLEVVHPWGDDYLLDRTATLLADEGMAALTNPHRLRQTHVEPGKATHLGVVAWCDSGAAPGVRWGHLTAVAERLACQRAQAAATPTVCWDDAITRMPAAAPSATYGRNEARWQELLEWQRLGVKRPINEKEHEARERWRRQRVERTGRR